MKIGPGCRRRLGHGFVRTIARYLGLNEDHSRRYDLARSEQAPAPPPNPKSAFHRRRRGLAVLAFSSYFSLVADFSTLAAYGWHRYAAYRAAKESPLLPCPRNLSLNPVRLCLVQRNNPPPLLLLISPSPPPPPRASASSRTANFFLTRVCPPGRRVTFGQSAIRVTAGDSSRCC